MQLCFGHTSTHEIHLRFYFYSLFQLSICTYSAFYIFFICALCMQNTSTNSSIQEDKIAKRFRAPPNRLIYAFLFLYNIFIVCFIFQPQMSQIRGRLFHSDHHYAEIRLSIRFKIFLLSGYFTAYPYG